MATIARPSHATHEVHNQAAPLRPANFFALDLALQEALEREGGGWAYDRVHVLGELVGRPETLAHSERAERNEPILRTHDRYGHRVDEVELDPSWHALLRTAIEHGLASVPWREARDGAHVARAALFSTWGHANGGVLCPVSMTNAIVPALRAGAPELAARWEDRLTLPDYDAGALGGMAMTEKQGGSDVRANTTVAVPTGDGTYAITGHKWFCSYPPCDVFLVLAQTDAGLSCFLVDRAEGGMEFQRLKDKLGTRSLPSSEVEFRGAVGRLVGEEGRGVKAIITMVNHTRLDCLLGSTTSMRHGTMQAIHHARHRAAFGAQLVDQPLMRNVLADLAVESEAATAAALRVARAFDDPQQGAFRRFATAVMKYHVCKRAPQHAGEALECLGGNGFVEESGLPLLYRDAPLQSIWEGSGNVAALDVLRALVKEPEGLPAFLAECELARGGDARLDAHLDRVQADLATLTPQDAEFRARRIVEDLGFALQGALLVRHAPAAVADAFCASRLSAGGAGHAYGTLPVGVDAAAIVDRALPA
ncbi:DNA alkylation response protein [Conexibacter sp. W3-3-2]|uniref:DNA alkylation response protein n=1 Tax=Paraconexibacter algicola TaxID=2133960 RepID=A0A2T4UDM6_9ACTN|nr:MULTISPECIES: acyl-CoA dehydrogenase family protein [Solirubrobacterales]MTD43598.1 DNA alkylation response protein [Conexibacter sp. W3-3-2]PTL55532.1 DNA alkylation response protein [Paraconexibacter algicola]